MKIALSSSALADLERLQLFLAVKNADASRRAVSAIIRAIDTLKVLPDRGRLAGVANLRDLSVPFGKYGYVIRFAHDADMAEIIITRIWHGREDRL